MISFRLPSLISFYILILASFTASSQVSELSVQVNWPNWASENILDIYAPDSTLLVSICDPANCKTNDANSSYSATINLGCFADFNDYYFIAQDLYGDGWNGAASEIIISAGGVVVSTFDLNSGFISGPQVFEVSGGGSCPSKDAGILSVSGPTIGCELSNSETFEVTLTNQGADTISNINVSYSINSGSAVSAGTYTDSIAPGSSGVFSFNLDLSAVGQYNFNFFLSLNGDLNTSNDSNNTFSIYSNLPHNFNVDGAYSVGFESSTETAGWSTLNLNEDAALWQLDGTNNPRTGSNVAIYNYSIPNSAEDWMFTKCLSLDSGSEYAVEFYYRVQSGTYPEDFDFHLNSSPNNSSVESTLASFANLTNISYVQFIDTISVQVSSEYYLAWEAKSDADMFNILIDDFSVRKISPIDVGITDIILPASSCNPSTSEIIQVNIENFGTNSVTSVPVEYSLNGAPFQSAGAYSGSITSGNSDTYSFSADLSTPGATQVRVRTALAGDLITGNDQWIDTATSVSANLTETSLSMGFEAGEDLSNWTILNNNNDNREWQSSTAAANNGSNHFRVLRRNANGSDDWLFTPCTYFESGEDYILNFSYRARQTNANQTSNDETMYVLLTDGTNTSSTIDTIGSYINFTNTTYIDESVEFTVPATGVYYVSFLARSAAAQRGIYIDDIAISNKSIYWTGNSSSDWNDADNWSSTVPSFGNDAVIPSSPLGNVFPTISSTEEVQNLTIQTGATINFSSSAVSLTIFGNYDGETIFNDGSIIFNGNAPQTITGANTFHYLEIDNGSGVSVSSGSQLISHELRLESGVLSLNGNMLTIESNALGDARIAPVNTGSIDGDVTVKRYIDEGATNWRFLASPISDGDFEQWDDDIITSGFTGSDYPNFGFVSIYGYQESIPGIVDLGYVPLANSTQPMNLGEGYTVWSGSANGSTDPFTMEVTGTIHTGTFNFPLGYTNTGDSVNDGWNLVGNPYASAIDWDSTGWTKTNIDSAIYVWNPDENQFAAYVNGTGTLDGSRFIASGQSFWVHAFDTPTLVATENVKSDEAARLLNAQFAKEASPIIRLQLQLNNLKDEIVVRFKNGASDQMDRGMDALKMKSSSPQVPFLYSQLNGEKYSINSLPIPEAVTIIPIATEVNVNGSYFFSTIEFKNFNSISCVLLEDLQTGEIYDLKTFEGESIYMTTNDVQPRFQLSVHPMIMSSIKNATCYNEGDGRAEFDNTQSGFLTDVFLRDQNQNAIDSIIGIINDSSLVFNNLDQGLYFFSSGTTPGSCPSIKDTFRVSAPAEVLAYFQPTNTENPLEIFFENLTIGANSFEWSFGDGKTSYENQPTHKYDSAGIYGVTLNTQNKNSCESSITKTIKVESQDLGQFLGVSTTPVHEPYVLTNLKELEIYIPQNSIEPVSIRIYSLQGALLYEQAFGTTNNASINLNHLASSVYLVELNVGSQRSNHKIILP